MKIQPYFAVRVVVEDESGSTYTRDYVRGDRHIGQVMFTSYALGDLIRIVSQDGRREAIKWDVFEVDANTVLEASRGHHLTH